MEYQLIYQPIAPEFKQSRTEAVRRAVRGVEAIEKLWPQGLNEAVSSGSAALCCREDLDYRYQLCVIGGNLGMWIYPLWAKPESKRWKDRSAVYAYRLVLGKDVL